MPIDTSTFPEPGWRCAVLRSSPPRPEIAAAETLAVLQLRPRATAIFTVDSDMTLGALDGIRRGRKRIPKDVSLLAFDDLDWAAVVDPPLTVVAQPVYDMGTLAAQRLLARLDGDDSPPKRLVLKTRLIERGSTAAPG